MVIFGPSLEVLHWSTAVAAAIGLLATFAVLRRFLSPGRALFGTAVIAILPAYGILATSYMTDITAFAAEMVCLALGLAALEAEGKRRWVLLVASLALGLFGFAVREIAIAAPVAVLAGHLTAARRRGASLHHMFWPPTVLIACAAVFLAWRRGVAGDGTPDELAGTSLQSIVVLGRGYFTLALGLLPALVLGAAAIWRERLKPTAVAATGAAVALAALVVLRHVRHDDPVELPLGDYFGRSWELASPVPLASSPPVFLPGVVWAMIDAFALAAGVLLAVLLVRAGRAALEPSRWRYVDSALLVLVLFGLLYASLLVYTAVQGGPLYERHFLPLTVPLVVLPLRAMRARRAARVQVVIIAALASLTVVTVVHAIAFRGAEWDAGERAVADGTAVRDVDAGFAWVGYHARGRVRKGPPSPRWKEPRPFYANLFPGAGNCLSTSAVALSVPQHGLLRIHEFRWIPGLRKRKIWVYRNREACRAARQSATPSTTGKVPRLFRSNPGTP
jgi:hypothetical protein